MKKFFCLILLTVLLFTTACTKAKKRTIKSEQQFIQAVENYHKEKTDLNLYAITNYIQETEYLGYKGSHAILFGFFTGILHEHPVLYDKLYHYYGEIHLVRMLQLVEKSYDNFEYALDGTQKFYPEGKDFITQLWGYYYATGDMRVIKLLCKIKKYDFSNEVRFYAKNSLVINQKKFSDVDMKCE